MENGDDFWAIFLKGIWQPLIPFLYLIFFRAYVQEC